MSGKQSIRALSVLAALLFGTLASEAAAATFEGTVSDTMCGTKHMIPTKSPAECIKECTRENVKFALVIGDKTYALSGPPSVIAAVAGKHVRVIGEMTGDTITIDSISALEKSR
jgi:hypothetical protein